MGPGACKLPWVRLDTEIRIAVVDDAGPCAIQTLLSKVIVGDLSIQVQKKTVYGLFSSAPSSLRYISAGGLPALMRDCYYNVSLTRRLGLLHTFKRGCDLLSSVNVSS